MTEHEEWKVYMPPSDPTLPGWAGYWETWTEIDMWEASDIVDAQEALL